MEHSISILIKTFERQKSLVALLNSISNLKLNYPILIADDSKVSSKSFILKKFTNLSINYINLPFDSGLSKGRNELLSQIKTPYFILCDDDFVFDERTDVLKAIEILKTNHLDVLGGNFYNYIKIDNLETFLRHLKRPKNMFQFICNNFTVSRHIGNFKITNDNCELLITNSKQDEIPLECDLVNNFFIANTQSVLSMGGWDPNLKLGEHEDFFLRVKQANLKVAYLNDFGVRHYPIVKSNYKAFRLRAIEYKKLFIAKHKFQKFREINVDTNEVLFEL